MAVFEIEGKPGEFYDDETGRTFSIKDLREDIKYDTVSINAGAMVAGTELEFFDNVPNGKRRVDTNFATPHRLSAGEEMVIERVGFYLRQANGNLLPPPADFKRCVDDGHLNFLINGLLLAEGPCFRFQTGFGFAGNTNEAGNGIVSIGVPSTAAAWRLVLKQYIHHLHDINSTLTFFGRNWNNLQNLLAADQMPIFTTIQAATSVLYGRVKRATTKG